MRLNALSQGCCHLAADKRILREVLEVPATEHISVDIESRCQPQVDSEDVHLGAYDVTAHAGKINVKALSDCCCDRYRCRVLFPDLDASLLQLSETRTDVHDDLGSVRHVLHHSLRDARAERMLALPVFIISRSNTHSCRAVSHDDAVYALILKHAAALSGSSCNSSGRVTDNCIESTPRIERSDVEISKLLVIQLIQNSLMLRSVGAV